MNGPFKNDQYEFTLDGRTWTYSKRGHCHACHDDDTTLFVLKYVDDLRVVMFPPTCRGCIRRIGAPNDKASSS